jgi:guanylate kinase
MFGGVKEIASKPGKPQPVSRAIKASPDFIKELEERLVLFYTGKSHFAGDILTKLTIDFISKSRVERESRERLSLMDRDIIGAIERGDVDALGALITDFWKEWKILNPEASNDDVEALFAGIKDLVSGGKLCGAGGGGFAMFIAQKGRRGDVENRLREMYPDADERIYRGTVNKDGVSMTLYASSDTRLLDSYLNHVVYEKILIEATAGTIGRGGEISGAVLEGLATAVGEGVSLAITGDMANKLNSELKKRISSGSGSGRITVYGGDLSARELNAFGWKTRVAAIMDGSISKSRYKAEGYGCFSVTGASPANSHAVSMPLVDGLQLKGADATEWLLQHLVTKPAVDRLCDQISTLKEGQLVIFSGFSGTGKGTLFDLLSSVYGDKMTKVLLYTTRDMRKGEKQDREYHFVSPEEFERTRKDKDMVSVSIHGPGKMYGVRIDDIEKAMAEGQIVFVEVGHEMGKALRERYPKAASIFMIPTDDALEGIRSELRFRLKVRASENEDGIASRLRTAETEDIARHGYGNNIVNERWGLYGAAAAFVSLVNENASALRAARMTEAPGDLFDEANIRRNQPAARKLATALAVALVPALALAGDGGASVLSAAKEAMFAHPYVAALGCAVIGLVAARFIWMRFYPVSWYMRELRTADPALKFKAADKLGRICAIEDVPVLVEAMDDRGWFVRLTAANILDDIGWKPSDAEERIAYLIAHQKWDLVARSGIQAYAMLLRRLDDADSGFLSGAIWALGRTGGAMAAKPLIRLVNEGNLDVRGYAAETLADLGEPAVKPVIEAVMEEHSDIALIGVLKDIGLPAVDPLIEELRGDERSRKERAAYALGEVRKNVDAAARSRIDEAVGSYKPEEQSAAALFDLVESADVSKDSPIAPLVYMARKAKREDQKLIIGLETDWIPAMDNRRSLQSAAIASLMKEIQSIGETLASMGLNNVEIVRSDSHALANAVIKAAVRAKTDMRNVIIIASSDTIYSDSFTILRNTRGGDRPFMAAIDPQELVRAYEKLGEATGSQLHITLKDLLYITVALAAGKEPPKTPLIVTYDKNMRFVIFMPKAEPMDYERLRDTYKAEAVALAAA